MTYIREPNELPKCPGVPLIAGSTGKAHYNAVFSLGLFVSHGGAVYPLFRR